MSAAYAHQTRPASTSKPPYFSKREWYRRARADVRPSGRVVAEALKETVGRCLPDENVFCSVVWRTLENLRDDAGLSYRTFARRRDEFAELGYLLDVDSGCGPQRYFVLKFPEWSNCQALEYAAWSLRAMCKYPGRAPQFTVHIQTKILPAILKEWDRQIALEEFEDADYEAEYLAEVDAKLVELESECDPDQVSFSACVEPVCDDPPEGLQELWDEAPLPEGRFARNAECSLPKMQNALLIYRESTESPLEGGDSSTVTRAREARSSNPPPPHNQDGGSGSLPAESDTPQPESAVELDDYRQLKRVFIGMFAQFERRLDSGCAARLARLYLERGAWPKAMKLTLDEKLTRLFGDGFSTGQVVRFLVADVDEWTPPPGLHDEDLPIELRAKPVDETTSESSSPAVLPDEEALALARSRATPLGRRQAETVWEEALEVLSGRVSKHLMETWILGFRPIECVDGQLVGMEYDDFRATWVRENHAETMSEACGMEVVILSPEQVFERYRRED
jgi:hypothetical protein